jgi:tRNA U55 pseudouridine synthase TruB
MKIGAHMIGLKRIRAGIFKEDQMVSREDFGKAVDEYEKGNEKLLREIIIPAEIVSEIYPVVEVKEEPVGRILHGQPLYNKDLDKKYKIEKGKSVCVFSKEKFIGMFKVEDDGKIFGMPMFVYQEIRN